MSKTKFHDWQARREALIRALCQDIQGALSRGDSLEVAVHAVTRRYKGRSLGDGRKLRLSRPTIHRHWYRFRKNPVNFTCKITYPVKPRNFQPFMAFLAAYFSASEGMNPRQAFQLFKRIDPGIPFSYATLVRYLRPEVIATMSRSKQYSAHQPARWWLRNAKRLSSTFSKLNPRGDTHDG